MENTLLFGNGLNICEQKKILSWGDLLKLLAEKCGSKREAIAPNNTLYYEELISSLVNNTNGPRHNIQREEESLKKIIAENFMMMDCSPVIQKLPSLNFTNYITTNYDFSLERAFKTAIDRDSNSNETIYSVRRRSFAKNKAIWHIHGAIDHPKSIMLGYDHYCGYVSKIDQYVKGHYSYKDKKIPPMAEKIDSNYNRRREYTSWIDLFFMTDVHIMGFGLDYSEIDLWWVLNKRARMMNAGISITNKIVYYGDLKNQDEKKAYLQSFNVKIEEMKGTEDWPTFNRRILDTFM